MKVGNAPHSFSRQAETKAIAPIPQDPTHFLGSRVAHGTNNSTPLKNGIQLNPGLHRHRPGRQSGLERIGGEQNPPGNGSPFNPGCGQQFHVTQAALLDQPGFPKNLASKPAACRNQFTALDTSGIETPLLHRRKSNRES